MPYKDLEQRRIKNAEYSKKYYQHNKTKVLAATKTSKKKRIQEWREFKATLSCEKCGQNHPATLDFHHIVKDKSNRKVHSLTRNGNVGGAMQEIKKCQVLCANCHRIHHHEEYQRTKVAKRKK